LDLLPYSEVSERNVHLASVLPKKWFDELTILLAGQDGYLAPLFENIQQASTDICRPLPALRDSHVIKRFLVWSDNALWLSKTMER
jgi:hypothetical protein